MSEFVKLLRKNDKEGLFRLVDEYSETSIDAVFKNLSRIPEYIDILTRVFDASCSVTFESGREKLKTKKNELKKQTSYIVDFKGTDYTTRSAVSNLKCFLGAATIGA